MQSPVIRRIWDRAGIQQQLRAYGGRHNGETDRENRASLDRLERTPKDVCFLVSILQVREQVVSFYVSFPESALNASIALIVSIRATLRWMDWRSCLRLAATIELH